MTHKRTLDVLWLLLLALTVGGALLGENAGPGLPLVLVVVVTMALKGRLVIDYFMEMKDANRTLRNLMRVYFYVLPALTLVVYLFGERIVSFLSI